MISLGIVFLQKISRWWCCSTLLNSLFLPFILKEFSCFILRLPIIHQHWTAIRPMKPTFRSENVALSRWVNLKIRVGDGVGVGVGVLGQFWSLNNFSWCCWVLQQSSAVVELFLLGWLLIWLGRGASHIFRFRHLLWRFVYLAHCDARVVKLLLLHLLGLVLKMLMYLLFFFI